MPEFGFRRRNNKRFSSKPNPSLIKNFKRMKFNQMRYDTIDSILNGDKTSARISFKSRNPLMVLNKGPSKKGMFDDMKKINLQTTRKLKKKIDLFIEPYNKVNNTHFFMRFGDDPYPRLPQCLFSEGIKTWRKISTFILEENNSSFNNKMSKFNNEEFYEMKRRIKKSRDILKRQRKLNRRGTIRNCNNFFKMKYSGGTLKKINRIKMKGGSPSVKSSNMSSVGHEDKDEDFFKCVESEKLNSSVMTQNNSNYITEVTSESQEFSFETSEEEQKSPRQRQKAISFKKIRKKNSIKFGNQKKYKARSVIKRKKTKAFKEKSKYLNSFFKPKLQDGPIGASPMQRPSRFTENSNKGSRKSISSLGLHAQESSVGDNMKEIFFNFKTQEFKTEKSVKLNFNLFQNSVIKEEKPVPRGPKKLLRKHIMNYFYKGNNILTKNMKILSPKNDPAKRVQNSRLYTDRPRLFDSIKQYSNHPHQVSNSQKDIKYNPIHEFEGEVALPSAEKPLNITIDTARIPIRPLKGRLTGRKNITNGILANPRHNKHESRLKFNKRLTKYVKRKLKSSQNRRRSII
ncbi:unnamed protein product [Moneuplotes crassus]|uniref:Uncharacterized protein n=1 Tax=Euplotes crassus TaxID=5936 RepID=A0AAD2D8F3_EUPCR|nr:unnamed protein product [Moneuplotes crassus]